MLGRACKLYIFRSYNISAFNAMRFDENPFTSQCKKKTKKAEEFQIMHFHWSFSNDITTVKGFKALAFQEQERTSICSAVFDRNDPEVH